MTIDPALTDARFFGYGSLVNRATHDYPASAPAQLNGWRRAWCETAGRPVAILTAIRAETSCIDGLVATVPGADWRALDKREALYERRDATVALAARPHPVAVYEVPASARCEGPGAAPILLSYLDVVIQGYLREFGAAGAARFFETTDGWDRPVLNDRAAPRYPRHQRLSAAERAFVDDHLAALAVVVTPRD
jgi:hypothetical protein